jgi:hypothetical protein
MVTNQKTHISLSSKSLSDLASILFKLDLYKEWVINSRMNAIFLW